MGLVVQKSTDGAKGVDTIATFTPAMAAKFKAGGYSFVVRYLGAMHPQERDAILGAGLAILTVGYSARPGWTPSAAQGDTDGAHAVANAQACGLPAGMTLFCDMEGPSTSAHASDCIDYINAWATHVLAAGYIAGLYVGYGVPMTPQQLYHNLKVSAYWHSCSYVQDVAVRGYQMFQGIPGNQMVLGTQVDIDTIKADKNGDTPMWLVQVPDAVA